MIEIFLSACCEDCRYAELVLHSGRFTDGSISATLQCVHQHVCKRALEDTRRLQLTATNPSESKASKIKFLLDGCDISFVAEAPADITLKQLLKQCDRIKPAYCACGIRSFRDGEGMISPVEISIDYNDIKKVDEYAPCKISDTIISGDSNAD